MKRKLTYKVTTEDRGKAAKHCRFLREMENISQAEMAELMGATQAQISMVEASTDRAPTWLIATFVDLHAEHHGSATMETVQTV